MTGFLFLIKKVWWFVFDNWRIVVPVIVGIVLLILVITTFKSCGKKASIDLESLNKINSANEATRKKELQSVIEKNQDVVSTVDNRSTIAETHVAEQTKAIDAKVKAVDQKIIEAKNQGHDVTAEEIECMLIPENCP